jgi:hypothetical protein
MYAFYKCNIWARSPYHCCRGKAICIAYSECVFTTSVILNAKRMSSEAYYIVICGLPCCTIFFTLCHTGHYFRKKKFTVYKTFVLVSSTKCLSATFLILKRIQTDIIINFYISPGLPLQILSSIGCPQDG